MCRKLKDFENGGPAEIHAAAIGTNGEKEVLKKAIRPLPGMQRF
jgi:hypothetical protein